MKAGEHGRMRKSGAHGEGRDTEGQGTNRAGYSKDTGESAYCIPEVSLPVTLPSIVGDKDDTKVGSLVCMVEGSKVMRNVGDSVALGAIVGA
eukprot:CAMPEP_0197392542 /NCGR_PEP_ID=MMETSP1165-20131217/3786_1 /TAXON_ID=284809 /ORGANISM="Chrysocystis fragilis, Strain CCMP3189" /LENGTH=91 /DNA_ID=CAMNT_0042918171 /DNA_START=229 /DNA_END=501 /DNA_ORIENTATION=-